MNKKQLFISLLTSLTMASFSAYANIEIDGNINFQNTQSHFTTAMVVNGNVQTKSSNINNTLTVNGSLTAHQSTFNGPLTVNGSLKAQASKFVNTTINGSLNCKKCVFLKDLTVSSNQIQLSHSSLKNLTINGQSGGLFSSKKTPKLYLNNSSIVAGNITFKNSSGVVYLNSGSKITGKIINGKSVSE